ncbi:hypothetical protein K2Z83_19675 [Oscillochloris sp. ZM17-4]|uniref:hypothetical protein n=1 Tax=Oscillochloris sp. ZM17-4 TaxID=2866714 RepID=UPI001C737DAF|nr:hypothetical protein [Oscillochloris sp. ZM17-4]MBX0329888.1 hypothetical protein [Oscillochloris sp. ZM17-4]
MREIALEAGVGRNELAGPRGYIQRLVALGLLIIVGYEPVPGAKEPRPIYHIDLTELERQSLDLVPTVLRERQLPPPPRPAPDPRQLALFAPDEPTPARIPIRMPEIGHAPATAPESGQPKGATPEIGRVCPEIGTGAVILVPESGQPQRRAPDSGTGSPGNGTGMSDSGTDLARNRDGEGMSERKDRVSESAHTHADMHQIAAQAAQTVIQLLRQQGAIPIQASPNAPASQLPTPADQPTLPADPLTMWHGDRETIPARERYQLAMLISEMDRPTNGHGAYWVGRAILIADRCVSERTQPLSLNYLRGMLRRWQREDSWGSDLELISAMTDAPAAPRPLAPAPPLIQALPTDTPAASELTHPAIDTYRVATGRTPNPVQAQQIAATVTDLVIWQRVLTDWQANGWQVGAVAKMLDRYAKDAGVAAPAPSEPPPSVFTIHTYPGLEPEQRDIWIRRFHAATTPNEKRGVLRRLEQEHPQ